MNLPRVDIDGVPTAPYRASTTDAEAGVWELRREVLRVRALVQMKAPPEEIAHELKGLDAICPTVDSQVRRLQLLVARLRLSHSLAAVPSLSNDETVPEKVAAHRPQLVVAEETITRCAVAATRTHAFLRGYLAGAANLLKIGDEGVALTVINKAVECVDRLREAVLEAAAVAATCELRSAA